MLNITDGAKMIDSSNLFCNQTVTSVYLVNGITYF